MSNYQRHLKIWKGGRRNWMARQKQIDLTLGRNQRNVRNYASGYSN
jgi:hypothetical protein